MASVKLSFCGNRSAHGFRMNIFIKDQTSGSGRAEKWRMLDGEVQGPHQGEAARVCMGRSLSEYVYNLAECVTFDMMCDLMDD
jgi:hypothetical protein